MILMIGLSLMEHRLPISLAVKQKRLKYWRDYLRNTGFRGSNGDDISRMLDTYAMLISKLAINSSAEALEETQGRVDALERELERAFGSARLITSYVQ